MVITSLSVIMCLVLTVTLSVRWVLPVFTDMRLLVPVSAGTEHIEVGRVWSVRLPMTVVVAHRMTTRFELAVLLPLMRKVGRLLPAVGLISPPRWCLETDVSIGTVVPSLSTVSVTGTLRKRFVEMIRLLTRCGLGRLGKTSGPLAIVPSLILIMCVVRAMVLCIVLRIRGA